MISDRKILSALKEFYPEIYKEVADSFREVYRPFTDIKLLYSLFKVWDYDTRNNFLGAVCLMFCESERGEHFLKQGTCKVVAQELNKKESNTSTYLSATWTIMKYRPEFKATCQLMVTILDNYKARCNE